ncbi:MAG: cytochrome c biogenesis protein CcsA [Thermoleophilia bacterium]|nr:cytochrome c biogenesis protein CcsA [Thermoleophilia bacterium]
MSGAGSALLFVAAAASLAALLLSLLGRHTGRPLLARGGMWALYCVLATAGVALLLLLVSFLTRDFGNLYVYQHSSRALPWVYTVSALWAGGAGSLLLWLLVLALFSVVAARGGMRRDPRSAPYLMAVLSFMTLFFSLLILFGPGCDPFAVNPLSPTPADGLGLNPVLRHPGMAIHPLALYLGYIAMAVPFGLMVAGLVNNSPFGTWIRGIRAWALAGWLFLTVGNVVGAWWAYVTLGWGGYWGWDPVENASLMPWLAATALLHSASVAERRRRMRVWTVSLVALTYLLTIFGTFLTRTGVVASVHAFTESRLIAWFVVFMVLMLALAVAVIAKRHAVIKQQVEAPGLFGYSSNVLYTVVLLLVMTFFILWGVVFPPIAHALAGSEIMLGAGFFEVVTAPLGLVLLLLLVICSVAGVTRGSRRRLVTRAAVSGAALLALVVLLVCGVRKVYPVAAFALSAAAAVAVVLLFVRSRGNRGRYGALFVHVGLLVLVVGLAGSWAYKQGVEGEVAVGESLRLGEIEVVYQGVEFQAENRSDRSVTRAILALSVEGKDAGELAPSLERYSATRQTWTRVARRSSAAGDIFVALFSVDTDAKTATFALEYHPLIIWLWIGGGIMGMGALVALGSSRGRPRPAVTGALEPGE